MVNHGSSPKVVVCNGSLWFRMMVNAWFIMMTSTVLIRSIVVLVIHQIVTRQPISQTLIIRCYPALWAAQMSSILPKYLGQRMGGPWFSVGWCGDQCLTRKVLVATALPIGANENGIPNLYCWWRVRACWKNQIDRKWCFKKYVCVFLLSGFVGIGKSTKPAPNWHTLAKWPSMILVNHWAGKLSIAGGEPSNRFKS